MKSIAVIVAGVSLIAACSSSHPASKASSGPSSTAPFKTTYGMDAALLAGHIPGCTGIAADEAAALKQSGVVASAHCTLLGHKVVLYTWKDAASSETGLTLIGSNTSYSAEGTGWSELLGDDAAGDAQQAVAEKVAAALGGTVKHS